MNAPGSFPVRCHNPVAADIDVTDNCFCTVFFAGLYFSSSFNKTAIIFHKNNEVFVNCDMYLQCRRFASPHVYLFIFFNFLFYLIFFLYSIPEACRKNGDCCTPNAACDQSEQPRTYPFRNPTRKPDWISVDCCWVTGIDPNTLPN